MKILQFKKTFLFTLLLLGASFFLILPLEAKINGQFELIPPQMPPAEHSLNVVNIHEIFAFTCPHCNHFNEELPKLRAHFGDKINIISTPIGWAGHDPGRLLYIAKRHGAAKEHQVKDLIFEYIHDRGFGDSMYKRNRLKVIARKTGLHSDFNALMDDQAIIRDMEDGIAFAKNNNVQSTPTLIVEGKLKVLNHEFENLKAIINSLLIDPVH